MKQSRKQNLTMPYHTYTNTLSPGGIDAGENRWWLSVMLAAMDASKACTFLPNP